MININTKDIVCMFFADRVEMFCLSQKKMQTVDWGQWLLNMLAMEKRKLHTCIQHLTTWSTILYPNTQCTPLQTNMEHVLMEVWKIIVLSEICRFHVNLSGCMAYLATFG